MRMVEPVCSRAPRFFHQARGPSRAHLAGPGPWLRHYQEIPAGPLPPGWVLHRADSPIRHENLRLPILRIDQTKEGRLARRLDETDSLVHGGRRGQHGGVLLCSSS